MTRSEMIERLNKIAAFLQGRADMAIGDAKMVLTGWWRGADEAAALLTRTKPRVMTLEEAQGDDEVWFEFRPSNVGRYADCYMSESGARTCVYFTGKSVMSLFENSEYGKTWRCWNVKPTDEEREAAAWE